MEIYDIVQPDKNCDASLSDIAGIFNTAQAQRVIFYLLLERRNVGRSYNEIAHDSGVGMATAKKVIDRLMLLGIVCDGQRRVLVKGNLLLQIWQYNLPGFLQAYQLACRMRHINGDDRANWRTLPLPSGYYWGGESAVGYRNLEVNPSYLVIYSSAEPHRLMERCGMCIDPDGDIIFYRKFWKGYPNGIYVPPLLIYASLSMSQSQICRNIAPIILQKHYRHLL